MKSRWKTQHDLIGEASKFHNRIRAILCTESPFPTMKCFQEVPVSDLVPGYRYTSHHVDWYVEPFRTVIELHGAQHYKVVNFGGVGYSDAQRNFRDIKYRDNLKKTALLEAGYRYLEIPYTLQKDLGGEFLMNLILKAEEYEDPEL